VSAAFLLSFGSAPTIAESLNCDDSDQKIAEKLPKLPNGCQKIRVTSSGNGRPSKWWAHQSAENAWKDQALTKFGERFAVWGNSACQKEECVPAALAGFTRCTISGFPCAPGQNLQIPLTREEVEEMQHILRRLGYRVEVDGSFGPGTASALERWQRDTRNTVDGLPTAENLEKLRKARREARRERDRD
jgi:hypothetical protein